MAQAALQSPSGTYKSVTNLVIHFNSSNGVTTGDNDFAMNNTIGADLRTNKDLPEQVLQRVFTHKKRLLCDRRNMASESGMRLARTSPSAGLQLICDSQSCVIARVVEEVHVIKFYSDS